MEESRARIEGVGGRGAVIELGVRDVRQVQELVARAVRDTGRLDIMINNAGLSYPTPIVDGDPEEWLRHAGDERAGAPRRLPGRRPRDARLQGPGAHRQRLLHRRAAARFGRSTARPSTRSPASATRCAASWRRIRSASWTCARVRAPADALAGLDALALRLAAEPGATVRNASAPPYHGGNFHAPRVTRMGHGPIGTTKRLSANAYRTALSRTFAACSPVLFACSVTSAHLTP